MVMQDGAKQAVPLTHVGLEFGQLAPQALALMLHRLLLDLLHTTFTRLSYTHVLQQGWQEPFHAVHVLVHRFALRCTAMW